MAGRKRKTSKGWLLAVGIILAVVLFILVVGFLLRGYNIPVWNPQGAVGVKQKGLIIFTLVLSAIVVIPVFTMLGTIAWKYREGNTTAKRKYTPDVDGNRWLEGLWWGIPIFIIGILSVVTWVTTHQLDPQHPLNSNVPALNVQVVALQWKWLFLYPDQGIASLNELKIPAGTPVNFSITADAPMSAFWIPALGTQVYAMTGMSSKLSLIADHPGTYRGTNSNINGKGYADMTFKVTAMNSRKDFDNWTKSILNDEHHNHIAWDEYKALAKPSVNNPVTYYHLHDENLYTDIINQYMPVGSAPTPTEQPDRPSVVGGGV